MRRNEHSHIAGNHAIIMSSTSEKNLRFDFLYERYDLLILLKNVLSVLQNYYYEGPVSNVQQLRIRNNTTVLRNITLRPHCLTRYLPS